MTVISHWKARRSGGRITINGTDPISGQALKVPNVDTIEVQADGQIVAINKDGARFRLQVTQ